MSKVSIRKEDRSGSPLPQISSSNSRVRGPKTGSRMSPSANPTIKEATFSENIARGDLSLVFGKPNLHLECPACFHERSAQAGKPIVGIALVRESGRRMECDAVESHRS